MPRKSGKFHSPSVDVVSDTRRISPSPFFTEEPGVGLSAEPMEASAADNCGDRPIPGPSPQERRGEFAAPAA